MSLFGISRLDFDVLLRKYHKLDSNYSQLSMAQNDMKFKLDAIEKRLIHYIEANQKLRQELRSIK